jgi:site-specific DNA-methyltransferase (adenine-specific)
MIELLNCDCMEYMATVPDKYFDLAIVDPPYGIGRDGKQYKEQAKRN